MTTTVSQPAAPGFLFAVVQPGSEAALKHEVARRNPGLRFAFSRPGFVTFRIPDEVARDADRELHAAFARTWGYSLGKARGADPRGSAREVWQLLSTRAADLLPAFRHLHVWRRSEVLGADLLGDDHFDAAGATAAQAAGEVILEHRPDSAPSLALNAHARSGDLVIDCALVEPDEWWVGWHRASHPETRWPAGVPNIEAPADMISRAYLKLGEALLWSELPIRAADRCVEIGSAPGGSCQALLARGCSVLGIDPAEMDPEVLAHPRFTHLRSRAKDVDRGVFAGCRWLTADINLPPTYTLDTVEAIVTAPRAQIEGLVLTLKLADPVAQSDELPLYNKRIRSWGYPRVRARQLAFNRQEVCVVATRS